MSAMEQFLLAFDHRNDRLVVERHFGTDTESATSAYRELEQQYRDDPLMDIVLVGSDSIDSVRVTHSNYFEGMSQRKIDAVLDRTS